MTNYDKIANTKISVVMVTCLLCPEFPEYTHHLRSIVILNPRLRKKKITMTACYMTITGYALDLAVV